MIKKLETIKDYGIFRDFKWTSSIPEFKKVNLFYGLNGVGKSTFSTIFDDIKNRNQRYFQGTFKIADDKIGIISSDNLDNYDYNLYVFNSHFIENNIVEFKNLKGIVYLSEENKIAKTQLEQLQKDYIRLCQKYESTDKKYKEISKAKENAFIKAAKAIKEAFISVGGLGQKYSNYNKTTFENSLSKYEGFINEKHDTKSIIQKVEALKLQLKDTIKPQIHCNLPSFDMHLFVESIEQVKTLLSTTIQKSLKVIIGDSIFTWLEEGYRLHKNRDNICKYCGNTISKERQAELDSIFSEEIRRLLDGLEKLKSPLMLFQLPELEIYESNFYASQKDITQILRGYRNIRSNLNAYIEEIIELIDEKIKDPFTPISIDCVSHANLEKLSAILQQIGSAIQEANITTDNFTRTQIKAIDAIEKLLVYYHYVQQDVLKIRNELKATTKALLDAKTEKELNEKDRLRLENELHDVIKAGTEFNELLSKFLGRKELELKYDEITKGYTVIRKESGNNAKFLSEGEKTAIAFVYFLTKVRENGNIIANTTIVFDDPISSFDSNHLYNAYSFIATYFSECNQLFILTHNFNFFKLVRQKYNKIAEMYLIDCNYIVENNIKKRNSFICTLPKSIKQASSEYTYLFEKAYNFLHKEIGTIEFDDYMQMSNTCRKIIESFSSFKIQSISDLSQKIDRLYKCNQIDGYQLTHEEKNEAEQIYRFVNAFSHESLFEETDVTDILFGELSDIVQKVINLIKRADKDHFNAMVASIT